MKDWMRVLTKLARLTDFQNVCCIFTTHEQYSACVAQWLCTVAVSVTCLVIGLGAVQGNVGAPDVATAI